MASSPSPSEARTASFAGSHGDLSSANNPADSVTPKFETARCEFNAAQLADNGKTEAQRRQETTERTERRESFMIKRDKPQPVLRPSPALARGTDRAVFNANWDKERGEAQRHQSRVARKEAFKSSRTQEFNAARGQGHAQETRSQR